MKDLVFVLFISYLITNATCNHTFYGNPITQRSTSGLVLTPAEPRIWVDDPLNGESWPGWGYLQYFEVYIESLSSGIFLPTLYLQIWTNSSMIGNYSLKWQAKLANYQSGQAYQLAPNEGQFVEVNEYDRFGFTNEGNYSTIALDLIQDDPLTQATAHRTYFSELWRVNNVLPVVGTYTYVDNDALRGKFSIGGVLDNAPPRSLTQVYCGHDLQAFGQWSSTDNNPIVDSVVQLTAGRLVGYWVRLKGLNTATNFQLQIWSLVSDYTYTLVYNRSDTLYPGLYEIHNVSISDGFIVNTNDRFGWNTYGNVYYTSNPSCNIYTLDTVSPPYQVGASYAFDSLPYDYEFAIGVIIDTAADATHSSSHSMSLALHRSDVISCLILILLTLHLQLS